TTAPRTPPAHPLTLTSASASNGTLSFNADRPPTYTPTLSLHDALPIYYTIQDNGTTDGVGAPLQSSSTVAVTVTEVNDAPTAVSAEATTAEHNAQTIINLRRNDNNSPANESGQTLTVISASASHGTVTI